MSAQLEFPTLLATHLFGERVIVHKPEDITEKKAVEIVRHFERYARMCQAWTEKHGGKR